MADTIANIAQTSFLGGEWSSWAQGRFDLPAYRTAMNLCLNSIPVTTGACVRRPGFADLGPTHLGRPGVVRSFIAGDVLTAGENKVYALELTYGSSVSKLRVWVPATGGFPGLLTDTAVSVLSVSTATPPVATMLSATTWETGDTAVFSIGDARGAIAALAGRQVLLTKLSTTTFSMADARTGVAINGSAFTYTGGGTLAKIQVFSAPYTSLADVKKVRVVQNGEHALFLCRNAVPYKLRITSAPVVTFADANFKNANGPYIDALPGGSQIQGKRATVTTADSGATYTVTPTAGDGATFTFASTDVNRCFRFWTQPTAYAAGTYNSGDSVTYNGAFWKCLTNSTTTPPGQAVTTAGVQTFPWLVTPAVGRWIYGYLSAVAGDGLSATLTVGSLITPETTFSTTADMFEIGLYTTASYPACGTFHEGRLCLDGVVPNRFDLSEAKGFQKFYETNPLGTMFAPTEVDGSVTDANAISATLDAEDNSRFLWMVSDRDGILGGTANGEWLISASTLSDPMTPRSVQAHQVTSYKTAFIQPARVGSVMLMVQAFARTVFEYLLDGSRRVAVPINDFASHIPDDAAGILEIAFQKDPVPVLWAVHDDGTLGGCTYRRLSQFATQPPEFNAWHKHTHGGSREFQSVAITSVYNGQDTPICVTYDGTTTGYRVEVMSRLWGPA